jgi:molybdopterin molybdotransferase
MLSLDEALARLLGRARLTTGETVPIAEASGRVLVEPKLTATVDVPPFANSAMDGFALHAADTPGELRLVGEVSAGAGDLPTVEPGAAVRIMTGAPMPPGADTVVPIEQAAEADGVVRIDSPAPRGVHVREAGHDTRAGDEICLPESLTPAAIAVLGSVGIGEVEVRRRPVVAILSTGDELRAPGDELAPGQIYDANAPALAAAVRDAGGVPLVMPRQADDPDAIEAALREAAGRADLVVTTGGVSVGRHDHVRAVLTERGNLDFWRIAVQPGKPLAVGELGGTLVIGLPGNPVSALVTFELFVRPLLRATLGLAGDGRLRVRATLAARVGKDPGRRAFIRASVWSEAGVFRARAAAGQRSSELRPMADANALLVIPEGQEAGDEGHVYEAIVLREIDLA